MTPERSTRGWRDVVIAFLVALLLGSVTTAVVGGVSEKRVRDIAREENAPLRETVLDLKGAIVKLTASVDALTVQVAVLQSRGSR